MMITGSEERFFTIKYPDRNYGLGNNADLLVLEQDGENGNEEMY